ncbi:unnamed protein product, partial [Laminaria digitata]
GQNKFTKKKSAIIKKNTYGRGTVPLLTDGTVPLLGRVVPRVGVQQKFSEQPSHEELNISTPETRLPRNFVRATRPNTFHALEVPIKQILLLVVKLYHAFPVVPLA